MQLICNLISNINLFMIGAYVVLVSNISFAVDSAADSVASSVPNSVLEDKFIARAAVVDVESILEHSTASAHLKKAINEISDLIQEEYITTKSELKNIEADLIARQASLPEEEFEKLVTEFNQKVSSAQKKMQYKKNALAQAHAEAHSEIHKNTIIVISELSKKYGFNIVLPGTQVLFVTNEMNITLEVISDLNKRLKTIELNYKPNIPND